MPSLMISTITIKNPAKLQDYLKQVKVLGTKHGAELLFSGSAAGAVAGTHEGQMVVVVRFPSTENIDALFGSDDYQPLIPLREEAAEMTIVKYRETA